MRFHDASRDRQPEAMPIGVLRFATTKKRLEDSTQFILRNTRPLVEDSEPHIICIQTDFQYHFAALWGMPQRIAHHILQRAMQKFGIARDKYFAPPGKLHRVSAHFCLEASIRHYPCKQFGHVDLFFHRTHYAGFKTG